MVKKPPANSGDTGSIPGLGESHMPQGNWARGVTPTKPTCLRARVPKQEGPLQWEALKPQLDSSPHLPQLEKSFAQQWRPSATKNKINQFKKSHHSRIARGLYWKCRFLGSSQYLPSPKPLGWGPGTSLFHKLPGCSSVHSSWRSTALDSAEESELYRLSYSLTFQRI